jgi:hypothetical protein
MDISCLFPHLSIYLPSRGQSRGAIHSSPVQNSMEAPMPSGHVHFPWRFPSTLLLRPPNILVLPLQFNLCSILCANQHPPVVKFYLYSLLTAWTIPLSQWETVVLPSSICLRDMMRAQVDQNLQSQDLPFRKGRAHTRTNP